MGTARLLLAGSAVWATAACGCSKDSSGPALRVAGHTFRAEQIRTRGAFRNFLSWGLLAEGSAYVVAFPRTRYHFYESHGAGYDILFTDPAGKVLEIRELREGHEHAVTSNREATHALFFRSGTLKRLGVKKGDRVEYPEAIRKDLPALLVDLRIGKHTVHAETALTEEEQSHGLMFRTRMSADDGMLFAYSAARRHSFWMRNTLLDLDIAFFRPDGTLIRVVEMAKYPDPANDSEPRAVSPEPAKYVLETHRGWFRSRGLIRPDGSPAGNVTLTVPPDLERSR